MIVSNFCISSIDGLKPHDIAVVHMKMSNWQVSALTFITSV